MIELLERKHGEPARQYAYRVLLYNIVNLNLKPGQEILETELCKLMGVSRTPIHEALLTLSMKKLVDIYPQRGTFVALIDVEYVEAVRFNRYVLESAVVKLACDYEPENPHLENLEENIILQQLYLKSKNFNKLLELDAGFHRNIFALCSKETAYTLLDDMMPHFDRERKLSFEALSTAQIVDDHILILEALKARNKDEAGRLMERHLSRALADQQRLCEEYPHYFKITD